MSGPRERKDGYDDQLVARLELIWGEGFLSPGGADEIRTLLEGTDVRGMDMLDIGCGTGGGAAALIQEHGAASVIGVDVEQHLVDRAADRAERTGLSTRLTFRTVDLGPFPFDEASFDAVFSKDAILHIPDKPALFSDVFRVLKRDGRFVASDWLKAEGRSCDALEAFLKAIEYSTSMETPATSARVLESVGFVDVQVTDRTEWLCNVTREDNERIFGALKSRIIELIGAEKYEAWTEIRRGLLSALEVGELRPSHLLARKPDSG